VLQSGASCANTQDDNPITNAAENAAVLFKYLENFLNLAILISPFCINIPVYGFSLPKIDRLKALLLYIKFLFN
jgi:hypothetical protein